MPIIRANSGIVTQINVFTVPEGGQQALIDHLAESARFASDTPRMVSASLHRSPEWDARSEQRAIGKPRCGTALIDRLEMPDCLIIRAAAKQSWFV